MMTIQIAKQLGISVPERMRIVGYDGTRMIRSYYPELATVVQPIEAISALMIDLLLKRIEDDHATLDPQYVVPVQLHAAATLLGEA